MEMSSKEEKLIEKHAPLKPKEVAEVKKQAQQAKNIYEIEQSKVEENLSNFLKKADPVLDEDGNPILYIRRLSMRELKSLLPQELMDFKGKAEEIDPQLSEKFEKEFYVKLAEVIVAPKKTAEEWEEAINPWLLKAIWNHFALMTEVLSGQIEGF